MAGSIKAAVMVVLTIASPVLAVPAQKQAIIQQELIHQLQGQKAKIPEAKTRQDAGSDAKAFLEEQSSLAPSSPMWFQPIEWTPAACFLAFQAGLTVLVGLILLVPLALGQKDGHYMAYYQKYEKDVPVTEDVLLAEDGSKMLRSLEMEVGSHNIFWGVATIGALVAGGAQNMCILETAPMLTLLFYFFRVGEKTWLIVGSIFVLAFCYFGFLPMPTVPSMEWQPASIFLALHLAVVVMVAALFLMGKAEPLYESQPLTKQLMNRDREILMGTQLLGGGVGAVGALIANGAENFCLIVAPTFAVIGYVHWMGTGDKQNAINNWVVGVIYLCFGIFPRMLQ